MLPRPSLRPGVKVILASGYANDALPANRTTPILLISDDQRPSAMSKGFESGTSFFLLQTNRLRSLIEAYSYHPKDNGLWEAPDPASCASIQGETQFGSEALKGETIDVS
jgi:hypothetical protein